MIVPKKYKKIVQEWKHEKQYVKSYQILTNITNGIAYFTISKIQKRGVFKDYVFVYRI